MIEVFRTLQNIRSSVCLDLEAAGWRRGCKCGYDLGYRVRRVNSVDCIFHGAQMEAVAGDTDCAGRKQVQQEAASLKHVSNVAPPLADTKAEYRRQILEAMRAIEASVTQLRVAYQRYDDVMSSTEGGVAYPVPPSAGEARPSDAHRHARSGSQGPDATLVGASGPTSRAMYRDVDFADMVKFWKAHHP